MSKQDDAVNKFCDGLSCSQAVLSTYGIEYGLDTELALKIATGFGGGLARQGGTCGAVTGAVMVIGLNRGSLSSADREAKEETYRAIREFLQRFERECGSTICRELLGCDISQPSGYARAREQNLFQTHCPGYVGSAMGILEEIIGK